MLRLWLDELGLKKTQLQTMAAECPLWVISSP